MTSSDPQSPQGVRARVLLRLLGAADLEGATGATLTAVLHQPKRVALLAYLALSQRFHQRDTLLALFWPESDEPHARNALSKSLHFLRDHLGDRVIESRGANEVGLVPGGVETDVQRFGASLGDGDLEGALALYRGDLLDGFHLTEAIEFERWLEQERTRLRHLAAETAWRLAEQRLTERDLTGAGRWARWAVARAPDDEVALRRALDLMGRAGDRAGVLGLYAQFRDRLTVDYGAVPDPETTAVAEEIRNGTTIAAPRAGVVDPQPRTNPQAPAASGGSTLGRAAAAVGVLATGLVAGIGIWTLLNPAASFVSTRYTLELEPSLNSDVPLQPDRPRTGRDEPRLCGRQGERQSPLCSVSRPPRVGGVARD